MAIGRKGSKVSKKIGILAYGEQGTWKSSLGCEAVGLKNADGSPVRLLAIDSEFGGIDTALEEKAAEFGADLENTYVIYTESYSEIMDILDKVKNNEDFYTYDEDGNETDEVILDAEGKPFRADFIMIDGTTVVYNASSIAKVKFSERRARVKAKADNLVGDALTVKVEGADLEYKDYKKLNKEMSQEFILKVISTGKHYYITARETDEKKKIKTSDGKTESIPTGKKIPDGFKDMEYNVNTLLRLYIDEEGLGEVKGQIVNKDRSGVHNQNEIIDEPTLLDWQQVIDGNKGLKNMQMNPTFAQSIEKELQNEINSTNLGKESTTNDLTPDQYKALITEALKKLSAKDKPIVKAELSKQNLEKFREMTDIAQLKAYLAVVERR